jgi:urate oxidase
LTRSQPVRPLTLPEINVLDDQAFAAAFAGVLEHSPQYAQYAAGQRPFADAEAVAAAFAAAVQQDSPAAQLSLIRAHPDLAGKAALAGDLTAESAREQASAGLDRLTPAEYAEFQELNSAYHEKFGLPYVVCVREHTKDSIFEGARRRLSNSPEQERAAALHEIARIARLRILDLVQSEDLMQSPALIQNPASVPSEEKMPETVPTTVPTPVPTKVKVKLGANNYGKADVRLFKVFRDAPRHEIKDVWVRVAMEGDFDAAHVSGDNTDLLATDTVRNTIYGLAVDGFTGSVEEYGKTLIRHFVAQGPKVARATAYFTEHQWQRLSVDGQEHDHSFVRQMPKHTAVVEGDGQTFTVTSGIDELYVLKTTQSGWEGYLQEQFTTLPETNDRILATVVTAKWEYAVPECDYDAVWGRVYQTILDTFTDHYSPSVQNTLYRMGEAILTLCPEISRVHFSFPNRHHIRYNTERHGIQNPNTVFHADAEPYGQIEGWVERA